MEHSIDREKVISGLKYCTHTDGTECPNCPYWHNDDCIETLNADVLSLLKEQEAIRPFSDDDGAYWCGSCHEDMVWHQKFCSNCGKPVLWEGR